MASRHPRDAVRAKRRLFVPFTLFAEALSPMPHRPRSQNTITSTKSHRLLACHHHQKHVVVLRFVCITTTSLRRFPFGFFPQTSALLLPHARFLLPSFGQEAFACSFFRAIRQDPLALFGVSSLRRSPCLWKRLCRRLLSASPHPDDSPVHDPTPEPPEPSAPSAPPEPSAPSPLRHPHLPCLTTHTDDIRKKCARNIVAVRCDGPIFGQPPRLPLHIPITRMGGSRRAYASIAGCGFAPSARYRPKIDAPLIKSKMECLVVGPKREMARRAD